VTGLLMLEVCVAVSVAHVAITPASSSSISRAGDLSLERWKWEALRRDPSTDALDSKNAIGTPFVAVQPLRDCFSSPWPPAWFSTSADPGANCRRFKSDPLLSPLVKHGLGLRVPRVWLSHIRMRSRAMRDHQISVTAARTASAPVRSPNRSSLVAAMPLMV